MQPLIGLRVTLPQPQPLHPRRWSAMADKDSEDSQQLAFIASLQTLLRPVRPAPLAS